MNFHGKHVTGAKAVSPQVMIQMAFDDANGDSEKAASALIEQARFSEALKTHLIARGASTVVGELRRSDNARIFTGNDNADVTKPRVRMAEQSLTASPAVLRRAITASTGTLLLLNVVLPNGVRMANAKRGDIEDAVRTFEVQANDMSTKARYYKLVLMRLPDSKSVGQVFTDEALTKILGEAKIPA